jgi:hypothetical protein
MRPVHGVVRSTQGQTLVIKLESGLTIKAPKAFDYGIGDTVNLAYDFTRNKLVGILAPVCKVQEHKVDQVDESYDSGEISELADADESDSGALEPPDDCDECALDDGDHEICDIAVDSGFWGSLTDV